VIRGEGGNGGYGVGLFGSSSATGNSPAISGLDKNVLCLSHERCNLNKNLFKAAKLTHFGTGGKEAGCGVGSLRSGNTIESGPTTSCGRNRVREADYGMRSVKSRSATCNGSIIPSAIRTVTLPEGTGKKLKQPAGVSEAFWKAVEETVSVVENFAPSGGSSWPSVSDVIVECFIT
jgi:hypothetical protein